MYTHCRTHEEVVLTRNTGDNAANIGLHNEDDTTRRLYDPSLYKAHCSTGVSPVIGSLVKVLRCMAFLNWSLSYANASLHAFPVASYQHLGNNNGLPNSLAPSTNVKVS